MDIHDKNELDRGKFSGLFPLLFLMRIAAIVLVVWKVVVVALILFSIFGYADNFATGRDYSKGFDYRLFWWPDSWVGKIYLQGIWYQAKWTIVHGGLAMLPFLGIAALVAYVKKRRLYFLTACLVAVASPLVIGTIVQIRDGYAGDAQKYSSAMWLVFFMTFTGWAWLELWLRERRSLSSSGSGFQFSLKTMFAIILVLVPFLMKL